jgi:polysaccharide biosynthesis/export protein
MKPFRAFIGIALLVMFGSALAQQQNPPTQQDPPGQQVDNSYKIGAEDVVSVAVRDHEEASGDFIVRSDGKITVPIIGEVSVAGMTIAEVRDMLTKKFGEREFRHPEVFVNVKTMRPNRIYVLGSVNTSGMLDWKPGWRLTELISAAGGLSTQPEQLTAIIWRKGSAPVKVKLRDVFQGEEKANVEVLAGDTVNITGKPMIRVTVTGKTQKQGLIDVFEKDGASEAVAAMGGPLPDGALSRAKILRNGKEIPVDLYSVMFLGQSDKNVSLQDGDIINVPENKAKVAVVGRVGKPGPVEIPDGRQVRLTEAIGLAGGPVSEAKTDAITLARRNEQGVYQAKNYNMKDILNNKKGMEDPVLQDGDVVMVAQSGKPNSNTLGSILGLILTGGGLFGRLGGF